MQDDFQGNEIAVVGVACRFPDADTPEAFWENLIAKRESIVRLSQEQLRQGGVADAARNSPDYVPAGAPLANFDKFDADLFKMTAKEAEITDPQHRLFLECAWEALEAAGSLQRRDELLVGVYGGAGPNTYLLRYFANEHAEEGANRYLDTAAGFLTMIGNDKDYVCTRTSFKLDLRGPSINVQSACSTGLLSVHLACQGLQLGECDIALAGASSVLVPHGVGYLRQAGGIVSSDGHCRAFDASADGTVFASGAGVVALKRLDDAVAAGDFIHAVIRGSAANNDGSDKASFGAPSVRGQADVIRQAISNAGVSASSIGYIETHGTGTPLGDPIEARALSEVFGGAHARPASCALGAVKTNIGHLSAAAGIAGLIKAVLSLRNRTIPPTLHFEQLNPEISFEQTPFFINTVPHEWSGAGPRRAGVTSLGVGGTNVHVVLQEAPARTRHGRLAGGPEVLALSAHSEPALRELATRYRDFLRIPGSAALPDIVYSANTGPAALPYRLAVVAPDHATMAEQLDERSRETIGSAKAGPGKIAFLFPGQGAQYADMGRTLYEQEPVFRHWIETAIPLVQEACGVNLLDILFPANPGDSLLDQARYAQPALLAFEHALAQLWLSRGIRPYVMIGHSLGEYTAACLSGVISFRDALRLVAVRSRLMQDVSGSMLAVALSAEETARLIAGRTGNLWIAAINAPNSVVISGTADEIAALRNALNAREITNTIVNAAVASHCPLMEQILPAFNDVAETVTFSPADLPIIANVTGTVSPQEMSSRAYWCDHLLKPVQFARSVETALQMGVDVFLEIGPRPVLSNLGKLCVSDRTDSDAITWISALSDTVDDRDQDASALAQLHKGGVNLPWRDIYRERSAMRVPLPAYPFQRRRFWPTPERPTEPWFHRTLWSADEPPATPTPALPQIVFVCGTSRSATDALVSVFERQIRSNARGIWKGARPIVIRAGDMKIDDARRFIRNATIGERPPECRVFYAAFPADDAGSAHLPVEDADGEAIFETARFLREVSKWDGMLDFRLTIMTRGAVRVGDKDTPVEPSQTAIWSLGAVFSNEHPDIWGSLIDLDEASTDAVADRLINNDLRDNHAFRHGRSFTPRLHDTELTETLSIAIDSHATYLVTGGLGGIGASVARWLADEGAGNIVLVGRSADDEMKRRALASLQAAAPTLRFEITDVASDADMARLFETIDASGFPLKGVFHAAGVNESGMFPDLTRMSLDRALRPKFHGTMALDRHTRGRALDFFICFSSLSSMLGFKGQAAYVAANAAMEGVVTRRVQDGLPGLAICWGLWEGDGMSSTLSASQKARLSSIGVRSFLPETGLAKLRYLLGHSGVYGAFPIDWASYLGQFSGRIPPLLSHMAAEAKTADASPKPSTRHFKEETASLPAAERERFVIAAVCRAVAKTSGAALETVATDVPINRMGFDSLTTLELRDALKSLGIVLPLGPLFAGASVSDIAHFVLDQIEVDTSASPQKTVALATARELLVVPKKRADARIKLVCFAYAGGGPAVFNGWAEGLGPDIELAIVQPPGRGSRLIEPPYRTMKEFVDEMAPALVGYLDRPFALFGHCVGGVQAFELAHCLYRAHGILPVHLFVAGSRAPQVYTEAQAAADAIQFGATAARSGNATDQDFIDMLQDVNFANNKALFKDRELLSLMLPVIKADYQLNNSYTYQPRPPLSVPITAFGGRADPYTSGRQVLAWQAHTTLPLTSRFCPGDHYFMETQNRFLIETAAQTLADHSSTVRRAGFRVVSSH